MFEDIEVIDWEERCKELTHDCQILAREYKEVLDKIGDLKTCVKIQADEFGEMKFMLKEAQIWINTCISNIEKELKDEISKQVEKEFAEWVKENHDLKNVKIDVVLKS